MAFQLSLEEGKFLVELTRKTVEEYLKTGKRISLPKDTPKKFLQPCGVFVTINTMKGEQKELRGCIGYPYPTTPLIRAVTESAIESATQDPRFCPLSLNELDSVVFEISVLTPPQLIEVKKPNEHTTKIKVGKDGLIVERGMHKGLLLPQVPVEWCWDEEEFLCQCCIKANLPPDSWLLEGTKVYNFSCIIVREKSPKGSVEISDMRKE